MRLTIGLTIAILGVTISGSSVAATPGDVVWKVNRLGSHAVVSIAIDVEVSPDGRRVVATGSLLESENQEVFLVEAYDSANGTVLWSKRSNPKGRGNYGTELAFSANGKLVFVTGTLPGKGFDDVIVTRAFATATGERRWSDVVDRPRTSGFSSIAANEEGVFVTFGVGSRSVTIAYGPRTGRRLWTVRTERFHHILDVLVHARRVYVAGSFGVDPQRHIVKIWVASYAAGDGARRWVSTYGSPGGGIEFAEQAVLSPDGSRLFTVGMGGDRSTTLTLAFDTSDGTRVWEEATVPQQPGDSDNGGSIAVAPDGSAVYVANRSFDLYTNPTFMTIAYDTDDGSPVWTSPARENDEYDTGGATDIATSPDGSEIFVTGSGRSTLGNYEGVYTIAYRASVGAPSLWESSGERPSGIRGGATAIAVAPDGSAIYVAGSDNGAFHVEALEI